MLAAAFVVLLGWDALLLHIPATLHYNDFGKFYYSARAILEHADPYVASPASFIPAPDSTVLTYLNLNPPHFLLLVVPFATLRIEDAWLAWWAFSSFCLLATLFLVWHELGRPRLSWRSSTVVGLFFVGSVLTGSMLVTGQLAWILLLAIALVWRHARRNQWGAAACLIGVLVTVKPFLALLLVLPVAQRRFRFVIVATIAAAVTVAAGVALCGVQAYVSWIGALRQANWTSPPMNASLSALVSRLFEPNPFYAHVTAISRNLAWLVNAVAAVSVIVLTAISVARDASDVDRGMTRLLTAAILTSPLGWVYYLWLLVPSFSGMCRDGLSATERAAATLFALALMIPLPLTTVGQPRWLATATIGSAYVWGLLALWLAVLSTRRRDVYGRVPTSC